MKPEAKTVHYARAPAYARRARCRCFCSRLRSGRRLRRPHRADHPGAGELADGRHGLPAPDEDSPAFVKVGDTVTEGQTLLLIEAMKTFNPCRRRAPARSRRSSSRTPSRSNSANRSSSSNSERDVREDPHRQPRRDRTARPARLQGDGHHARSRCIRKPTATPCMCASPTRASASARRRRAKSYLNIPAIMTAARDHARRCDPSGLRLPVGERQVRGDRRKAQDHLHRPEARAHPDDGRQDHRQGVAIEGAGMPVVPGSDGGVDHDEDAKASPKKIGYPVLIKAAAGGGGRGMKVARTADEAGRRLPHRAHRSQGRVRQRRRLHGEVSRASRATSRSRSSPTAMAM